MGLLLEQDPSPAGLARWRQQPPSLCSHLSCPAVSQICNVVCSPSTSSCFIWKSTPARRDSQALLLCPGLGTEGAWGQGEHRGAGGCTRGAGGCTEGAGDVSSELISAEAQQEAGLPCAPVPCQHQPVHGAGGHGFLAPLTPLVRQVEVEGWHGAQGYPSSPQPGPFALDGELPVTSGAKAGSFFLLERPLERGDLSASPVGGLEACWVTDTTVRGLSLGAVGKQICVPLPSLVHQAGDRFPYLGAPTGAGGRPIL